MTDRSFYVLSLCFGTRLVFTVIEISLLQADDSAFTRQFDHLAANGK